MAWIPLLLASWIVVDVVIVAVLLEIARRRRRRAPLGDATFGGPIRAARGDRAVSRGTSSA